jgi:predicted nucleic acid-binding protein
VRRIVADTGPVLHLAEAGALALLHLAGEIWIPVAVNAELARYLPDWSVQIPAWLNVDTLDPSHRQEVDAWQQAGLLHAGEAEAVGLARQLGADWLLTDDTAARLFARALGLEVHGSLGVVLWAAGAGHLTRADADVALDRLAQSSLWISPRVLSEARTALDQLIGPP